MFLFSTPWLCLRSKSLCFNFKSFLIPFDAGEFFTSILLFLNLLCFTLRKKKETLREALLVNPMRSKKQAGRTLLQQRMRLKQIKWDQVRFQELKNSSVVHVWYFLYFFILIVLNIVFCQYRVSRIYHHFVLNSSEKMFYKTVTLLLCFKLQGHTSLILKSTNHILQFIHFFFIMYP